MVPYYILTLSVSVNSLQRIGPTQALVLYPLSDYSIDFHCHAATVTLYPFTIYDNSYANIKLRGTAII